MAPGALAQVLGDLPNVHNDNLLVGFDTSDDASVFRIGDNLGLVQSIDFFPPMVDDPFLFGQIAAANSLSDIYAMGGRPSHAMNLLCIPSCLGVEVAGQILAGGADKCVEAGCTDITGFGLIGHACEMAEGSGVQIELASGAVPLFDQVLDMARLGIIPAGSYRNQDFFDPRVTADDDLELGMLDTLYDPQTSGGLLIAAPAKDVDELARRLDAEGRIAAVVGRVCEAELGGPAVRVVR